MPKKKDDTVPARKPTDFKQTGALYQRSLTVRNTTEDPHGPGPDADSVSGKEKTVAFGKEDRTRANRERLAGEKKARRQLESDVPMEPETIVPGSRDERAEKKADAPKKAAGSTASPKSAKVEKTDAQVAEEARAAKREKRVKVARGLKLEELEKELPIGSEIQFGATEVRIRAPIAGGAIRYFSGRKLTDAIAAMHEELEEGPASLIPDGGQKVAQQFAVTESPLVTDKEAKARTPAVRGKAPKAGTKPKAPKSTTKGRATRGAKASK